MVPILIWEKRIHYETKTTPYRMNKAGNLAQCGKDQLEIWLFYKKKVFPSEGYISDEQRYSPLEQQRRDT